MPNVTHVEVSDDTGRERVLRESLYWFLRILTWSLMLDYAEGVNCKSRLDIYNVEPVKFWNLMRGLNSLETQQASWRGLRGHQGNEVVICRRP
jgi:hypothetical protein